jgi:hypothetical protein
VGNAIRGTLLATAETERGKTEVIRRCRPPFTAGRAVSYPLNELLLISARRLVVK